MVKLLHHYETQSNRIFLLLEHVQGGRLVDHVQSIRDHKLNKKKRKEKRKKSKKETSKKQNKNTTTVVPEMMRVVIGGESKGDEEQRLEGDGEGETEDATLVDDTNQTTSTGNEDDDKYMENLLEELTNLAPPTSLPVTSSLGGVSTDSQTDSQFGEDELDELRKQLEDQEIKEEEEDEEERDILSELRKQLMELTSDPANQGDQANLEKQLEEELSKEKTVLELEEELDDELEEAIEETVEELQDDTNLMELERQLMAFTTMIPAEEVKTELHEELISTTKGTTDGLDEENQFNSVNVPDDTMESIIVTEDKPNLLDEIESHSDVSHPFNEVENEPNKPHPLTEVENQFDKSHPLNELEDQPTSIEHTVISVVPPTPTTPSSEHLPISVPFAPSSSLSKNMTSPKSGSPKPVDEIKK